MAEAAGRNALLLSVRLYQKEYIPILVANGMDVNSRDFNGNTALHSIFFNVLENDVYIPLCKEFSMLLLEMGANPYLKNNEGKSPMDLAIETGEQDLIDLLKSSESI